MWLLSLLFVYGFLPLFSCQNCIQRILQCSNVRNQTESREFLPYTDETLEELCRSQEPYIRCVFDVALPCTEELSALVKMKFLNNEGFFQQFCRRGSNWWTKYLENSKCVNRQDFQVCILPDYIGALRDKYDLDRKCSALNEIMACVARIISNNCGNEAEDLFLSLVVLATDYDFKCAIVGRKSDGETISESNRSSSPEAEDVNQLKVNLSSEPVSQVSVSEDGEKTVLNSTKILRRTGENLHHTAQKPSMSSAFVMQDEIQAHSSDQMAENVKLYDETIERPLIMPVTFVEELHETSQEELNEETNAESDVAAEIPLVTAGTLITKPHEAPQEYSNEGSDSYINLDDTESSDIDDTESSSLEDAGSGTGAHHIKYLENVRYHSDTPKVLVTDMSKNFAARAMAIIRRILHPSLDIEAFKYSDETVRVYWEHPFELPFETLVCRQADVRERFFGKSFTCVVTLH